MNRSDPNHYCFYFISPLVGLRDDGLEALLAQHNDRADRF
jgi:hypothetical protein